jgi:hypothetical protein
LRKGRRRMKFTDKYELLETLTTGAVETFVANDRIRGDRVLVHIVECLPSKPDQSIMEWVLESFRRLAPEPVGPVLETGKYSGAQYGYLVTRAPDEAAEKGWVRRYELQTEDTRETVTGRAQIEKASERSTPPTPRPILPAADLSPTGKPDPVPVSMTQLLRNYDSQTPLGKAKESSAGSLPGMNLGQGQSGLRSASPWEPVHEPAPPAKADPVISRQPDSSSAEYRNRSLPFSSPSSASKDSPKPGEFTSFFQGPFRGEPSEVPVVSSEPIEPPQRKVGDFTAMFGPVGGQADSPRTPLDASGISAQAPSFTGMFKDFKGMEPGPQPFGSMPATTLPAPPSPSVLPARPPEPFPAPIPQNKEPFPAPVYVAPPPPLVPPLPPLIPLPPTPSVEKPSVVKPNALPGDRATGAFMNPSSLAVPPRPEAPAGPSPYTQIISRDRLMAPSADREDRSARPAADAFSAPPMPKIPAVPPPKVPQAKLPPKPKVAPPKLPKVDVPPPPVSYVPLVITLAVLLLVAVVVVLFLVLKH